MKKTLKIVLVTVVIVVIWLIFFKVTHAQVSLSQGGTGLATSTSGDILIGTSSKIRYTRLPIGTLGGLFYASTSKPEYSTSLIYSSIRNLLLNGSLSSNLDSHLSTIGATSSFITKGSNYGLIITNNNHATYTSSFNKGPGLVFISDLASSSDRTTTNDILGRISFLGTGTSLNAYTISNTIQSIATNNWSSGSPLSRLGLYSYNTSSSSMTEVLTIAPENKVGINVNDPDFALQVNGDSRITPALTSGYLANVTFGEDTDLGETILSVTFDGGLWGGSRLFSLFDTDSGASMFDVTASGITSSRHFNVDVDGVSDAKFSRVSDTDTGMGFITSTADTVFLMTGGTQRLNINPSGYVGIGTSSPLAKLSIVGTTTTTGKAFSINNSSGTEKFYIQDQGYLYGNRLYNIANGSLVWDLNSSQVRSASGVVVWDMSSGGRSEIKNHLTLPASAAGNNPLILKGFASQTANLTDWQNSGGTALVVIDASGRIGVGTTTSLTQKIEVDGGVRLNTATSKPTCSVTTRGTFWVVAGGASVKDTVEVCAKDAADAYAWRTIY